MVWTRARPGADRVVLPFAIKWLKLQVALVPRSFRFARRLRRRRSPVALAGPA